jgi:uncharacterized protein with PQ loop repeat
MNEQIIKIAFLFLPGLIGDAIFRKLTGIRRDKSWQDFAIIFMFALISYLLSGLLVRIIDVLFSRNFPVYLPIIELENNAFRNYFLCIALGSITGILVGFLGAYIENKNIINKIGIRLRISERYGGEDVWSYLHKKLGRQKEFEWVFVIDYKTNLVYYGHIVAFSESEKERELLMSNVDIFSNESGEKLYSVDYIYICRDKYDLSIEVSTKGRR